MAMTSITTEEDLRDWLIELLDDAAAERDIPLRIDTFAEAGVLTRNEGIVLRFPGGEEFQITIVKRR